MKLTYALLRKQRTHNLRYIVRTLLMKLAPDHFTTGHVCLEILTQGRSPLLSVKISLFDVFKQLLTLHKLTPTSDATSQYVKGGLDSCTFEVLKPLSIFSSSASIIV